jgi:lysophospholipase L1-like esterase
MSNRNCYAKAFAALSLMTMGCSPAMGDELEASESNVVALACDFTPTSLYLGIGDSIAFGQNGFIPYTPEARPDASAFVGYPDMLGNTIFFGRYKNIGCPGESTASFFDVTAPDFGCQSIKQFAPNTLHVPYQGSQSAEVLSLLATNHVKLVTISIGGNDLLLVQKICVEKTPTDPGAVAQCLAAEAPAAIGGAAANVGRIFSTLRASGYRGQIAYVNLYATNYADPTLTGAVSGLNNAVKSVVAAANAQHANIRVADAFTPFSLAAKPFGGDACAAGLLIRNPVQPVPAGQPACDVHPSPEGARLLAKAVVRAFTK